MRPRFNQGSRVPQSIFSGEEGMKTLIRPLWLGVAVAFAFSTWTFAADASADLFQAKCASCHGPDGKGETAMGKSMKVKDLASADVQKQPDTDLTTIIEKGKKPMPGYEGKLTKDQMTA